MRISIAAGSRGDIQPFVALGERLKKAGYNVTIRAKNGIGVLFNSLRWLWREILLEVYQYFA
jgi:UDP:flavonoid glycosyltransferase YjiC (YdhE family)